MAIIYVAIYEVVTSHSGVCKHSLLYDGRLFGRLGVWIGAWNVGSICGKGGTEIGDD